MHFLYLNLRYCTLVLTNMIIKGTKRSIYRLFFLRYLTIDNSGICVLISESQLHLVLRIRCCNKLTLGITYKLAYLGKPANPIQSSTCQQIASIRHISLVVHSMSRGIKTDIRQIKGTQVITFVLRPSSNLLDKIYKKGNRQESNHTF